MTLLFDAQLPYSLSRFLPAEWRAETAQWRGWARCRNGELLQLATEHGFDPLLTLDRNMQYQIARSPVPVVVLVARGRGTRAIRRIMPEAVAHLKSGPPPGFHEIDDR